MSLFGESFDKKVTGAIEKLKAMNLGVTGLNATIEGETVTLTGEASSPEAKGRVMQEFNALVKTENTINSIRVPRPAAPVAAAPVQAEAMPTPGMGSSATTGKAPGAASTSTTQERWYTVVKGDTLSKIAKEFYGDGNKYRKIFDANRNILDNPDLIKPGQKLRIPN